MPLRMEGASKKKREGYCSHEALCLLLLCENASLSLCFDIYSCEDNSLCIVLIKRKRESWQKRSVVTVILCRLDSEAKTSKRRLWVN